MNGNPGGTGGIPTKYQQIKIKSAELYDLKADIGEKNNVADQNPEVMKRLLGYADQMRSELGDSLTGQKGTGGRAPGRFE